MKFSRDTLELVTESAPPRPWHCNLPCSRVHLRHFARICRSHDKASRLRHLPTGVLYPTCDQTRSCPWAPDSRTRGQPRHSDTPQVEFECVTTKKAERPHLCDKTPKIRDYWERSRLASHLLLLHSLKRLCALLGRFKSTFLGLATRIARRHSTETGRFISLFDTVDPEN